MGSATAPRVRGSAAVKAALIAAAADMLGEVGPRNISVRDVADRAGVNHGQIHHYFGGKRGLLEAAMQHLAREHFDHAMALQGDGAYPPPLSLAEDVRYWRAIAQAVIEGDLELAGIEIAEGHLRAAACPCGFSGAPWRRGRRTRSRGRVRAHGRAAARLGSRSSASCSC